MVIPPMKSIEIKNLSCVFLIAVPALRDPNFEHTVVLICEHSADGAFGLIVNRVLVNSFAPFHSGFDIKECVIDLPVFFGGPVKPEQGYVLYSSPEKYYPSIKINDTLSLTTTKDILADIAAGKGPGKFLFALGFAGWSPGQLEQELIMYNWLVAPADNSIIFDTPVNERWKAAADLIGVDLNRIFCKQGLV